MNMVNTELQTLERTFYMIFKEYLIAQDCQAWKEIKLLFKRGSLF